MAARDATESLTLVRVLGRRYRQYEVPIDGNNGARNAGAHSTQRPIAATQDGRGRGPSSILDGGSAHEDEEGLEAVTLGTGRREFTLRMPVAAVYHRFIVGTRGETIKRLAAETGATILVPRAPSDCGTTHNALQVHQRRNPQQSAAGAAVSGTPAVSKDVVVITAATASLVRSAETRIALLISDARDKLDFTHFVSVPLALDPSAGKRLKDLQDTIFADEQASKVRRHVCPPAHVHDGNRVHKAGVPS
jgi:hypothetical protein